MIDKALCGTVKQSEKFVIAYPLHRNLYLNVTSQCTLRCRFCPKFNGTWTVHGYMLRLYREPTLEEIVASVDNPRAYDEIVFSGLGEPTLRLYTVLEAAQELRRNGGHIRLNTDGLANLVYERDVTPDLESIIDALSISLNAQDEETYNYLCRPELPQSYRSMLDFTARARDFVPNITLTAIEGAPAVDLAACEKIAADLGVGFRRRILNDVS